jgi:hypothetical protein
MEALGREFNVVPIAAGRGIALKGATGVTFVCTGADTFTLTSSATFGGSYVTPGNIVDHFYQAAATNGSAAFTRQAQTASNAVVQGGANTTVIEVSANSLPDTHTYIKCTASATGLVTAIVHDLEVQRKPANLPALSA